MQPFGTALGSGYSGTWGRMGTMSGDSGINNYVGGSTGRIVRHEKTAVYTTPVFNGFKVQAEYSFKNANATANSAAGWTANDNGYQSLSATYNNGPLNVMFAQQTIKIGGNGVNAIVGVGPTATTGSKHVLTTYAANYNMGAATVYGGLWSETQDAAGTRSVDVSGRILGVKYVIGAYDLLASTASTDSKVSTNIDRKITGFGANYNMSKRTVVYARYENRDADKNAGTDISTNGVTKTTAIGLKHSF